MRNQNIPMVIVSHDREFLDQVCTKIVDAEGGLCTEYQGNYSRFLQLKKGKCGIKILSWVYIVGTLRSLHGNLFDTPPSLYYAS